MIDGVKICFRSKTIIDRLNCLGVELFSKFSNKTGEEIMRTADFRHLKIVIYPNGTVVIRGSLHKYWKDENYSDFSHTELIKCINDLSERLGFNPAEAQIQNLEFGVNINTLFNPFAFCESVIVHKQLSFNKFQSRGMQIGFQCERSQYSLKVYDKGKQCNKHQNRLRFEIKTYKMAFIRKTGITTLADLFNKKSLALLGIILQNVYDELIIADQVVETKLTKNEKRIYNACSNPKNWEKFNKNDRYYKRIQFNNIVEKHGTNQWKKTVAQKLDEKWRMLLVLQTKN